MKNEIMRLSPYVSETIWGGRKLIDEYGVKTEKANAAEGWMLSALPNGPCVVINGENAGKNFNDVVSQNPSILGKKSENKERFPILIKFIDALDNLSLQVHPTDEYCKKVARGASKTECWYVMDCENDAGLILGFNKEISKDDFIKAVENNTLTEFTNFVKVKKGDFIFIPSGTLHAICKGILLAEVQESSDTTYRLYDYGRLVKDGKPRELHIEDGVNVTQLKEYSGEILNFASVKGRNMLTACDLFSVWHILLSGDEISLESGFDSFVSLLILSGEGELLSQDGPLALKKGDSIFIPAGFGKFTVKGNIELIETRI